MSLFGVLICCLSTFRFICDTILQTPNFLVLHNNFCINDCSLWFLTSSLQQFTRIGSILSFFIFYFMSVLPRILFFFAALLFSFCQMAHKDVTWDVCVCTHMHVVERERLYNRKIYMLKLICRVILIRMHVMLSCLVAAHCLYSWLSNHFYGMFHGCHSHKEISPWPYVFAWLKEDPLSKQVIQLYVLKIIGLS